MRGTHPTLASNAGTLSNRSITATVSPATTDVGLQGRVYVAASVPGSGLYFLSPTGWQCWPSSATCTNASVEIPTYQSGALPGNLSVPVVSNVDLSGIVGTQVYVGYGVGNDAATAEDSLVKQKDDLGNVRYKLVYTVQ